MSNKLCKHRHTAETHPKCFSRQWYENPEVRVGYLDIEASDLAANKAWMLSWSIQARSLAGKKYDTVAYDFVKYDEFFLAPGVVNREYDRNIVNSLLDEMQNYDLLVTYYGTGFDIPFIRTRAMILGITGYPKPKRIAHLDLYYHVRSKMSLDRNSLAQATKCLEIDGKTHLDFIYWKLAAMGDEKCMETLLDHNVKDVAILEGLHKELEPYVTFKKNSYI